MIDEDDLSHIAQRRQRFTQADMVSAGATVQGKHTRPFDYVRPVAGQSGAFDVEVNFRAVDASFHGGSL